jgi:hypothetical protein
VRIAQRTRSKLDNMPPNCIVRARLIVEIVACIVAAAAR